MTLTHSHHSAIPPHGHYVLIDGPSIDGTLGRVIDAQPGPETRPDWRRLEPFVKQELGPAPYSATFVLWAPGQENFIHFLQSAGFLITLGDRFVPGRSCADLIRAQIEQLNQAATAEQSWQVIVGTHNEGLIRDLPRIADMAERISVFGFDEHLPKDEEIDSQIDFYDIEDDARLFRTPLPRLTPADDAEDATWVQPVGEYVQEMEPYAPTRQGHETWQQADEYQQPTAYPTSDTAADERRSGVRDMYLIVDGRSIEKELGEILGEKPSPDTRPNWGRVLQFARYRSSDDARAVKALFAHIAPGHPGFRHALKEIGYTSRPVKLDEMQPMRLVVEEFICGLLGAQALRGDPQSDAPDIMVLGHGQAIFEALSAIPASGQRLCALGFPERMPPAEFFPRIEQLDLERDAGAFAAALPREFGVDVDNFDPDEEISRLF